MNPSTNLTKCYLRLRKLLISAFIFVNTLTLTVYTQVPRQETPVTLAQVLVALQNKKVTLDERNRIIAETVTERGTTFSLTAEIERELAVAGAGQPLLDAIRKKSPAVKVSAVIPSKEPYQTPEFLVHQQQADANVARGDLDAAVVEYGKAIEIKPTLSDAYFARGLIYLNKNSYDTAIADFSKVVELNPKDAAAFANRGQAWEKKGDLQKAKENYEKALELNAENTLAKTNLERIRADEAKSQPKLPEPTLAKTSSDTPDGSVNNTANANTTAVSTAPDSVDIGALSKANAIRMVEPIYPPLAARSNITGRVTVKVTLDEEGNVISAKAIDGHQLLRQTSEDAAKRSKFKPVMFQGKPIRATATITYNFSR
jgi:TonB family protein